MADVVFWVVDQFLQTAKRFDIEILAYCVIPDHIHLLVQGDREDADFKEFVRLAKLKTGYRFKREHRASLWQEGYYDRVLRDEETTESVVYYIVANPIRKGLVENKEDYPFWGSGRCTRQELLASIGWGSRV